MLIVTTLFVLFFLTPQSYAYLNFETYAVRVIVNVQKCSYGEWKENLERRFKGSIANALNKHCQNNTRMCHVKTWNQNCELIPEAVEYLYGYPKEVDHFHLELRFFVSHSLCCYQNSDRWNPFIPKDALLFFLHQEKETIEAESSVGIAFIELSVGVYENYLRRWTFTSGMGLVLAIIVGCRIYYKQRQRKSLMNEFWKRTLQRTKRNAAAISVETRSKARQSILVGTGGLGTNRRCPVDEHEESGDDEQNGVHIWQIPKPTTKLGHPEELRRRHMKKIQARMHALKMAQFHEGGTRRTAALMLFRRWNRSAEGDGTPPVDL